MLEWVVISFSGSSQPRVQTQVSCLVSGFFTITLTVWTFVGKVMSLLFNTLSRFVNLVIFLSGKYNIQKDLDI